MTVAELLSRISSRELTEWQAYFTVEPFGEDRADLRSAIVACVMASAWCGKKGRKFTVKDFMPDFAPKQKQSLGLMRAMLEGYAKLAARANKDQRLKTEN